MAAQALSQFDRQSRCRAHSSACGAFQAHQEVGTYKAQHKLPPADPEREKAQIARLRGLAEEAHLDPDFAEKLLNFIISEVIRHHNAIRG